MELRREPLALRERGQRRPAACPRPIDRETRAETRAVGGRRGATTRACAEIPAGSCASRDQPCDASRLDERGHSSRFIGRGAFTGRGERIESPALVVAREIVTGFSGTYEVALDEAL